MAKAKAMTAREILAEKAVDDYYRKFLSSESLERFSNALSTLTETAIATAAELYPAAQNENARFRCIDTVDSITIACKAISAKIAKLAGE